MPKPEPSDLQGILNEILRRLRIVERYQDPWTPPEFQAECGFEIYGDGTDDRPFLMGPKIDSAANNQLICSVDGLFVGGGQAVGWDAVVDGNATASDPDRRLFLGIGEACAYLHDLGLQSVVILVRHKGDYNSSGLESYVETANFNCPMSVRLYGAHGGWDTALANSLRETGISWHLAGFRPINATQTPNFFVSNFAELETGANTVTQFGLLYLDNVHVEMTGTATIATVFVARDSTFDIIGSKTLCSTLCYLENCDVAFRTVSGGDGTLTFGGSTLYFRGNLINGSSSGTQNCTFPSKTDAIIGTPTSNRSGINFTGGSAWDTWFISGDTRLWNHNEVFTPGSVTTIFGTSFGFLDLNAQASTIDVTGIQRGILTIHCATLNVAAGASSSDHPPPLVRGTVRGVATLNHVQCELGMQGVNARATIINLVTGFLNFRSTTLSSGTLISFVDSVASHLIVGFNEVNATGTAQPYSFSGISRDNLLIMNSTAEWPVSGTGAGGANDNLVLPEDFTLAAGGPYLPESFLDAKGDLITATADDTPAILSIGANDEVLTADSGEATGNKWALPTLEFQDEGVSQGRADTVDVTGAGASVSVAAGVATINIPGGGGGGLASVIDDPRYRMQVL